MADNGSPRKCSADPPRPLIRCLCIGKDAISMPVAKLACALQDYFNDKGTDPSMALEPLVYRTEMLERIYGFYRVSNNPNSTRADIRRDIIEVFAVFLPAFNWTFEE